MTRRLVRAEDDSLVGWVERSDTHQHRRMTLMGFASLYPSYTLTIS